MQTYAGIDLHSSNNFVGVINGNDKRLYGKRHSNRLEDVLRALDPFKQSLKGVVVESTFNWYWLVDGLQENGYQVHLANPSAMKQYEGLKHTDDQWDSFWLAHMYRLNLLAEGYIYPKEERPIRDLLRKRSQLVHQRTGNLHSVQNLMARNRGHSLGANRIKRLTDGDVERLLPDADLALAVPAASMCAMLGVSFEDRNRLSSLVSVAAVSMPSTG